MHSSTSAPLIRRLSIERFRGIKQLVWYPQPGVNVILGGGDVGKTTVLDAIALLFWPAYSTVLSEADYWCRKVEDEFCIEAVVSLPEDCGISQQTKIAWPWEWNGSEPELPKIDQNPVAMNVTEPVFRLRVRGTPEFDPIFEILQPDDTTIHLSVALRRKIGLVFLGGDDRNDRDLRLIQGSALDRLISDKTLRSRLGQEFAKSDVEGALNVDAKTNLKTLQKAFDERSLPTGLGLGLTGGRGISLNALIGLTATEEGVKLPLASWGAGTRRMAALEIAGADQAEYPITLVDEVERGLEPYRQRGLMADLQKRDSQVFVTTHSAAALSAAGKATIWHMDSEGNIGELRGSVREHIRQDPETFLARIAIIAEGPTEKGFVTSLLKKAVDRDLLGLGIWITDGGGNDNTLKLLEGLAGSGLTFGGFADDEGRARQKWKSVKDTLGELLFRWASGCTEENIIGRVPENRLEEFIEDSEGHSGDRRRTLAERLDISEKEFSTVKAKAVDLKRLIIEAATGAIPEDRQGAASGAKKALRKHGQHWFKSVDGGFELADKVFKFGLWSELETQLTPFLNAVRAAVSLPKIAKLPL